MSGSWSHAVFVSYVEREVGATRDPAAAIPSYLAAIEQARRCGATFVEGVASVALA